jgi:general secretion pathway protein J
LTAGTAGQKDRSAGFTLIEILVVLVIVALISGVLMFGFQRVLDIRVRLSAFIEGTDTPTLIASWFRESVDGMVPDSPKGSDRFTGETRRLTGLSLAPINGRPGVPTRIVWEMTFNPDSGRTALTYREGAGGDMTIASWAGDRGEFQYCGPDFTCKPDWATDPSAVPSVVGAGPSQLPALIRVDLVRGTEPWTLLAAPRSAPDALINNNIMRNQPP